MPDAAGQCDKRGLRPAPPARPGEHNKRQIVIGTKNGVAEDPAPQPFQPTGELPVPPLNLRIERQPQRRRPGARRQDHTFLSASQPPGLPREGPGRAGKGGGRQAANHRQPPPSATPSGLLYLLPPGRPPGGFPPILKTSSATWPSPLSVNRTAAIARGSRWKNPCRSFTHRPAPTPRSHLDVAPDGLGKVQWPRSWRPTDAQRGRKVDCTSGD